MPLTPEQLAAMRGSMSGSLNEREATPTRNSLFNTEPEKSERSQITKGLLSGIDQTQGLLYGAAALVGDATGTDSLKDWGMAGYERNMEEAAVNAPNVRFTEIDGIGDFGDWAAYTLGNLAPTMATMFATGGVGGAIAKKGIKEYGEKVLQDQLKKGIAKKTAEKVAKDAVAKRIGFGMGAGSFAGSASMEMGGIYGDTEDVGVSLAHGAIAGGLDAWPGIGILKRIAGPRAYKTAADSIRKSIPMDIGLMVLKEGGTEALQGFVGQHANYWAANEGKSLLGDLGSVEWTDIIEEGAAGMLGGMAFGGSSNVYSRWKHPDLYKVKEEEKADQKAREKTKAEGGDALSQSLAASEARMNARAQQTTEPPTTAQVMDDLNAKVQELENQLTQITQQMGRATDPAARVELGKQAAAVTRQMNELKTQQDDVFGGQTVPGAWQPAESQTSPYDRAGEPQSNQRQDRAEYIKPDGRMFQSVDELYQFIGKHDLLNKGYHIRRMGGGVFQLIKPTMPTAQTQQAGQEQPGTGWEMVHEGEYITAEEWVAGAWQGAVNQAQQASPTALEQSFPTDVAQATPTEVIQPTPLLTHDNGPENRLTGRGQVIYGDDSGNLSAGASDFNQQLRERWEQEPKLEKKQAREKELELIAIAKEVVREAARQGRIGLLGIRMSEQMAVKGEVSPELQDLVPLVTERIKKQNQKPNQAAAAQAPTPPEYIQNIPFTYANNTQSISTEDEYPLQPRNVAADTRLQNPHYRDYLRSLADQAYEDQVTERNKHLPENETVLAAIRRLGGLNRKSMEDDLYENLKYAINNKQVPGVAKDYYRIGDQGKTLDDMATALHEDGFHLGGRELTVNELMTAIYDELNGRPVFADIRTDRGLSERLRTSTNEVTVPAIRAALNNENVSPAYQRELIRLLDEMEHDPYFDTPEYLTREQLEIDQQRIASATEDSWFDIYEPAAIASVEAVTGIDPETLNAADWAMVAEAEHQLMLEEAAQHEQQQPGEQNNETDNQQGAGPTIRYGAPGVAAQERSVVPETRAETPTNPVTGRPEPTEAQKKAGNYKKDHIKLQGLDISLENLKGTTRSGTDPDGNNWSVTMQHHYGYIKRTEGADGDHVDVFVGENTDSEKVFIVDQVNQNGSFDEHKVMLGFDNRESAITGYRANYENGWQVGEVTELGMADFKDWLQNGDTTKPAASNKERSTKLRGTAEEARKQGFDTGRVYFHGTPYGEFDSFKPGPHDETAMDGIALTTNKEVAEKYASDTYDRHDDFVESRLIQAFVRGNFVDIETLQEQFAEDPRYQGDAFYKTSYDEYGKSIGIDGVYTESIGEPGELFIFDPESIFIIDDDADGFSLTSQTETELANQEAAQKAAEAEQAQRQKEEQQKAQADKDRDDFTLSGSNQPADLAMAGGQNDLLGAGGNASQADANAGLVEQSDTQQAEPDNQQTQEGPDLAPFEVDLGKFFGKVPYKPAHSVTLKDNETLIDSKVVTRKSRFNKHDQDVYELPSEVKVWRISVIKNAEGGLYSRTEYMSADHGRSANGEVLAYFDQASSETEDALGRLAPSVSRQQLEMFERAKASQDTGGLFGGEQKPQTSKPDKTSQADAKVAEPQPPTQAIGKYTLEPTDDNLFLVKGTAFPERHNFNTNGLEGKWNKENKAWSFPEDRRQEVISLLLELGKPAKEAASPAFIEQLKSIGKEWKKDRQHRVYFDNESLAQLAGTDQAINEQAKLWYDLKTDFYGHSRLDDDVFDSAVERLEALRDSQPEPQTAPQSVSRNPQSETASSKTEAKENQKPKDEKRQTKSETPANYGKDNKIFTEDAAEKAAEIIRRKLSQLNTGLDPELLQAVMIRAGYHIEAGFRKFADYAGAMVNDFGDGIKPFLKSGYEGVRYYPGFEATAKDMDSSQMVGEADIDTLLAPEEVISQEQIKKVEDRAFDLVLNPEKHTEQVEFIRKVLMNNDDQNSRLAVKKLVDGVWKPIRAESSENYKIFAQRINKDAIVDRLMDYRSKLFEALKPESYTVEYNKAIKGRPDYEVGYVAKVQENNPLIFTGEIGGIHYSVPSDTKQRARNDVLYGIRRRKLERLINDNRVPTLAEIEAFKIAQRDGRLPSEPAKIKEEPESQPPSGLTAAIGLAKEKGHHRGQLPSRQRVDIHDWLDSNAEVIENSRQQSVWKYDGVTIRKSHIDGGIGNYDFDAGQAETTPSTPRTNWPTPKDGWRSNLAKAREYAQALGIEWRGLNKPTDKLVDEIAVLRLDTIMDLMRDYRQRDSNFTVADFIDDYFDGSGAHYRENPYYYSNQVNYSHFRTDAQLIMGTDENSLKKLWDGVKPEKPKHQKNSFISSGHMVKFIRDNQLHILEADSGYSWGESGNETFITDAESNRLTDQQLNDLAERGRAGEFTDQLQQKKEEREALDQAAKEQAEKNREQRRQKLIAQERIYQIRAVGEQPWRTKKQAQEFIDSWQLQDTHYVDFEYFNFGGTESKRAFNVRKLPTKPVGMTFMVHEISSDDGIIFYMEPLSPDDAEVQIEAWTGSKLVNIPDTKTKGFKVLGAEQFLKRIEGEMKYGSDFRPKSGSMRSELEKIIKSGEDSYQSAIAQRILPLVGDARIAQGIPAHVIRDAVRHVVFSQMDKAKDARTGSPLANALNELRNIRSHVISTLKTKVDSKEANAPEESVYRQLNSMTLVQFVSDALSQKQTQTVLRKMKYEHRSLWSQFVEGVRKLLKIGKDNKNALLEVIRATDELLTGNTRDKPVKDSTGSITAAAVRENFKQVTSNTAILLNEKARHAVAVGKSGDGYQYAASMLLDMVKSNKAPTEEDVRKVVAYITVLERPRFEHALENNQDYQTYGDILNYSSPPARIEFEGMTIYSTAGDGISQGTGKKGWGQLVAVHPVAENDPLIRVDADGTPMPEATRRLLREPHKENPIIQKQITRNELKLMLGKDADLVNQVMKRQYVGGRSQITDDQRQHPTKAYPSYSVWRDEFMPEKAVRVLRDTLNIDPETFFKAVRNGDIPLVQSLAKPDPKRETLRKRKLMLDNNEIAQPVRLPATPLEKLKEVSDFRDFYSFEETIARRKELKAAIKEAQESGLKMTKIPVTSAPADEHYIINDGNKSYRMYVESGGKSYWETLGKREKPIQPDYKLELGAVPDAVIRGAQEAVTKMSSWQQNPTWREGRWVSIYEYLETQVNSRRLGQLNNLELHDLTEQIFRKQVEQAEKQEEGVFIGSMVEAYGHDPLKKLAAYEQVEAVKAKNSLVRWVINELNRRSRRGMRLDDLPGITNKELFIAANDYFGGTQAEGKYQAKDAYEVMELALNLKLLESGAYLRDGLDFNRILQSMSDLQEPLPTQSNRDDEQIKMQQFSTPHTHGAVAAWSLNLQPTDVVLEPTVGNGNLATQALLWGPAEVYGNELSKRRGELVKEIPGITRVFNENAEQLNALLPARVKPTVVIMNPPFSNSATTSKTKQTLQGANHVDQALRRLQDGGRLVAILGGGMEWNRARTKTWWKKTQQKYNVRAVIKVDGAEYAKFGTHFDNVIAIIDKTGPQQGEVVTASVAKVEELIPLLQEIRNDRTNNTDQPQTNQSVQHDSTATNEGQAGRNDPAQPGAGTDSTATGTGNTDTGTPPASRPVGNHRPSDSTAESKSGVQGDGRDTSGRTGTTGKPDSGRTPTTGTGRTDATTGGKSATLADESGGQQSERVDEPTAEQAGGNVTLEATKQESQQQDDESVFAGYQPQYKAPGSMPHMTKLSESIAMASVKLPPLSYRLSIPKDVIDKGYLTDAQLEAVAYAGQAHSQHLADGQRKGFFIGDGTGVGKTNEIMGTILDNWEQGRRRHVIISKSFDLMKGAKEWADLMGIGAEKVRTIKQELANPGQDGIVFLSYPTMIAGTKANKSKGIQAERRLDQLIRLLGKDFEGVIAFDESHLMANALDQKGTRGVKKASKTAGYGVELQQTLPEARVLYASATGATEVSNLAYADRLGLWGEGTAFSDKADFVSGIDAAGLAAMEIVAKDAKSMGMYLARSLSFDGVTQQRLTHNLNDDQQYVYNTLAEAWRGILSSIDETMVGETNSAGNGTARSAAMSAFWNAHQRFFNGLITSMQVPSFIKDAEKRLEADESVVVQLVSTGEATQERRISQAENEDVDLEDVDLTPRDTIIQFLENSFPTQLYETSETEDGNIITTPVKDSDGNPVHSPEAIERREALIEATAGLNIPEGPLDQIISHFGSNAVAEITGRKSRLVRQDDGSAVMEKRNDSVRDQEIKEFEDTKRRILVFSGKGGTGADYHAANDIKNQQRRNHYLLEPGWRADAAVQGFGRTHRTNQANEPHYVLMTTDVSAQKRFVSTIARRLEQLGALTKGQRNTTSSGMLDSSDNLENQYAEWALETLWKELETGDIPGLDYEQVIRQMGLINEAKEQEGGQRKEIEINLKKFLNRLLSMDLESQNRLFDAFDERIRRNIEYAKEQGIYEEGVEKVKSAIITKQKQKTVWEQTGKGKSEYVRLETRDPAEYRSFESVSLGSGKWVRNRQSKQLWRANPSGKVLNKKEGRFDDTYKLIGIRYGAERRITVAELKLRFDDVYEAGDKIAQEWDGLVAAADPEIVNELHLITGTLLPIWDRLPPWGLKVYNATTTDNGESFLGRIIPESEINQLLTKLGVGAETVTVNTDKLVDEVLNKGKGAKLANGWLIKRSRVAGEYRLELTGRFSPSDYKVLGQQGVKTERIAYKQRVFIPLDNAKSTINRITANRPVVSLATGNASTAAAYSLTKGRESGIPALQAKGITRKFPFVESVATESELPSHLQAQIVRDNHQGRVKGIFDEKTGKAYIVADKLASQQDGIKTALHEFIGHKGIRAALGNRLNLVLEQIYRSLPQTDVDRLRERYASQLKGKNAAEKRRIIADEYISHLAESDPQNNLIQRAVSTVRNWLRKLFPKLTWSHNDIVDLLRQSRKALNDGGPDGSGGGSVRYSLADSSTEQAMNEAVNAEDTLLDKAGDQIKGLKMGSLKGLLQVMNGRQITNSFKHIFAELANKAEGIKDPLTQYSDYVQKMTTLKEKWAHRASDVDDHWGKIKNEKEYEEISSLALDAREARVDPSMGYKEKADAEQLHKLLFDLDNKYQTGERVKPVNGWYKSQESANNAIDAMIRNGRLVGPSWLYDVRKHESKAGTVTGYYAVAQNPQQLIADSRQQLVDELHRQEQYTKLHERYETLTSDAKTVFRETRDFYSDMWAARKKAIIDKAMALMSDPAASGRIKALVDAEFNTAGISDFYVPFARFGEYVLMGESKTEGYFREHYDSVAEMEAAERQFRREKVKIIGKGKTSDFARRNMAQSSAMVANIYKVLNDEKQLTDVPPEAKQQFMDEVNQIALELLPELSAAKRSLHAKGTKGFSHNARRALADHAIHGGNNLAKITYGYLMEHQLDRMKEEADEGNIVSTVPLDDRAKAMAIADEMEKRHETIMNPDGSPWAARITNAAFLWFLGGSVGAGLVNLTQTPLVALPQIASRHGWAKTSKALIGASKDFFSHGKGKMSLKDAAWSLSRAEPSEHISQDEINMINELVDDGSIDTTQTHALAQVAGSDMRPESRPFNRNWDKFSRAMGFFFHNAEVFNRETTALAAYRLAKEKKQTHEQATDYARKAIFDGHFDYSAANRARLMKSNVAKVLTVFKQYSMNIAYVIGNSAYDWLKNSDLTKSERRAARNTLAGILGMHTLFAGTLGLPLMSGVLSVLSSIFSDDDEPWDAEIAYRNQLADLFGKEVGHAIAKGGFNALTGLDMHSRTSLSDLFYRSADFDASPRELYQHMLTQALGPVGSMTFAQFNGVDLLFQGRPLDAAQRMFPKFGRDVIKSGRYALDGAETLRGDVMVEAFNPLELTGQFLGMAPASLGEAYDAKRAVKGMEGAIGDRRSRLTTDYYRAYESGDRKKLADVRKRIRSFNRANPDFQLTQAGLRRSVRERQRRDRKSTNSIYLPDTRIGLLEQARFAI